MRTASLALLVLAAASACSAPPEASGAVIGTVQRVDLEPMAYDGDAVIVLRTDSGETVEVRVAARMNLCEAEGLAVVGELRPGDRVEVVGERGEDGAVRPCMSAQHRLVRA